MNQGKKLASVRGRKNSLPPRSRISPSLRAKLDALLLLSGKSFSDWLEDRIKEK
jgi:hypothetical protein